MLVRIFSDRPDYVPGFGNYSFKSDGAYRRFNGFNQRNEAINITQGYAEIEVKESGSDLLHHFMICQ